jgi:hypothetical protein
MAKAKFNKFQLPTKLISQLYELTGGPKHYKGFLIAYCDENGTPIVYSSFDSQITESGLIKSMENYLEQYSQNTYEIEPE